MRIGILTLPLHTNYGGILQAYALQTVLERMGHEVWIIDKIPYKSAPLYKFIWIYLFRAFEKFILGKRDIHIFKELDFNKCNSPDEPKRIYVNEFVGKHIKAKYIYQFGQINPSNFEAIVVGSDQIWRYYYINIDFCPYPEDAFLAFAEKWSIKRIAYAASFGTDFWEFPLELTSRIKALANRFDAISVREDSGIILCRKYLGIEARRLLDPTLLLNREDYDSLIKHENRSNGNLMCYILDQTEYKKNVISKVSDITGLSPFFTMAQNDSVPQPPVEQWLAGFRDANLIVTDSFHACIFSIIYHKPFIVIANESRGKSRFDSLLDMLDIKGNLIKEGDDITTELLLSHIDYAQVENRLQKLADESKSFLTSNL